MTKDEIISQIEREGGLAEAVIGLGIKVGDLPTGTPLPVWAAWRSLELFGDPYKVITEWLYGNGGTDVGAVSIGSPEPSLSGHQ